MTKLNFLHATVIKFNKQIFKKVLKNVRLINVLLHLALHINIKFKVQN